MPRKQTEEQVKRRRIDDLWESILRQELLEEPDPNWIWDQRAYAIVRDILETDGSWVDHTLWDSADWTRLDRVMKRLGYQMCWVKRTDQSVGNDLFYSKRTEKSQQA